MTLRSTISQHVWMSSWWPCAVKHSYTSVIKSNFGFHYLWKKLFFFSEIWLCNIISVGRFTDVIRELDVIVTYQQWHSNALPKGRLLSDCPAQRSSYRTTKAPVLSRTSWNFSDFFRETECCILLWCLGLHLRCKKFFLVFTLLVNYNFDCLSSANKYNV